MKRTTMRTKSVYAMKAVGRPTADGYAFLVIPASWDTHRDTLSFQVDGGTHEWHRRGTPVFETRLEALNYVRAHGWPLG